MKLHTTEKHAFFYDTNSQLWTLYPIDENKNRIEHDEKDNPIECEYFNNREELDKWLSLTN
jgi:hypothetical protein